MSGLVARLLTTDPELRPSASAILKSLILLNESVSVHNLDTLQVDDVSVSLDKLALEENPGQADSGNGDRFDKKIERSVRHWLKDREREIRHKFKESD